MTSSLLCLTVLACSSMLSEGFALPMPHQRLARTTTTTSSSSRPPTELNVWWFGGTEPTETTQGDSCELVAVRIERTSPNSRRIAGEITVEAPLKDVWSILTDYDQLAVHVPNLVESRTVPSPEPKRGEPGDGQYKCRLHQRGAQKIVGFEFGASVTMDMTEKIIAAAGPGEEGVVPQSRQIEFKCVDSPFFSEFDGTWKVQERLNSMGKMESVVSYSVEVRPKGPVPVAALEWRIREDVPTNLRAVKHAALTVGYDGVMAERRLENPSARNRRVPKDSSASRSHKRPAISQSNPAVRQPFVTARLASYPGSEWGEDETMAAYMEKDS